MRDVEYLHRIKCQGRGCTREIMYEAGCRPNVEGARREARAQHWGVISDRWYCPTHQLEGALRGSGPRG